LGILFFCFNRTHRFFLHLCVMECIDVLSYFLISIGNLTPILGNELTLLTL
jgi:hypothetical protein